MRSPLAPILVNRLTIVRLLAVALILSLAPPTGALAEGAAADGAAASPPGGAVSAPASGTAPAVPAASAVPEAAAAPETSVIAAPVSPPADSGPLPAPSGPPTAERKTEPNTTPAATAVDVPLPPPLAVTPGPAAGGAPAAVADPIPPRLPEALPIPTDLPPAPMLPANTAPARPAPPIQPAVDPVCRNDQGDAPTVSPPSQQTSPAAANTTRANAARGALPSAGDHNDARLYAGLPWTQCGPRTGRRGRAKPGLGAGQLAMPTADSTVPVDAVADCADYDRGSDIMQLRGAVQLTQGDRHLEADRSTYDRKSGATTATGHVYLEYPGGRMLATAGEYNLQTKQGTLSDVRYRLSGAMNLRGTAATAQLLAGDISRYRDVIYTTCPPGRSDWSIRASDLELDHQEGLGTAHHARVRFGPVPVFYTPYLQFPIDSRRRSGVLMPIFGASSNTGTDITIPYYWNIAPNLDATFFPRYMSARGPMLGGQVRALTKSQTIQFDAEVLPHDAKQPQLGVRWAEHFSQTGSFGGRWGTALDYSAVSDETFLTDFGNNLEVTSLVNLVQRAALTYAGSGYSVYAWLQQFQTMDPAIPATSRPYSQLPHIQLSVPKQHWGRVEYRFDGQYDYFDNTARVYGSRAVLLPVVSVPWRRSFGHLIPTVRLYATSYQLSNTAPTVPSHPSFAIPSLDLDTGLVFDRDTHWFGSDVLQTLEPRIYYVRTPYKNQSGTPLFDTTALTFSYASLFRPNRFTGYDRISDENRLTVGLTSRTLRAQDGREWLRVSLGEIFYFNSRQVQLAGTTADVTSRSSMAGELATNPAAGWTARASFQWNPNLSQNQWEQRALQLRYAPGDDRVVNLGYLYNLSTTVADRYENTDLSFRLPITSNIGVVGRWLYSLLQANTVEAFAGIEYGGRCCWRVRLLGRRLQTSATNAPTTSIMLQLELAGLGSIGDKIDKLLEQRIYGYNSD